MSVEVKLNRAGVAALLKSSDVAGDLRARAARIAAVAGPGMEAESEIGATRARASVVTATTEARLAEANHMALTRALDAGR